MALLVRVSLMALASITLVACGADSPTGVTPHEEVLGTLLSKSYSSTDSVYWDGDVIQFEDSLGVAWRIERDAQADTLRFFREDTLAAVLTFSTVSGEDRVRFQHPVTQAYADVWVDGSQAGFGLPSCDHWEGEYDPEEDHRCIQPEFAEIELQLQDCYGSEPGMGPETLLVSAQAGDCSQKASDFLESAMLTIGTGVLAWRYGGTTNPLGLGILAGAALLSVKAAWDASELVVCVLAT